jgi:hypothetical protein
MKFACIVSVAMLGELQLVEKKINGGNPAVPGDAFPGLLGATVPHLLAANRHLSSTADLDSVSIAKSNGSIHPKCAVSARWAFWLD